MRLSNWERFWLAIIVGSGPPSTIAIVRLGNRILDKLEFSDEEKLLVGWRELGSNMVAWTQEHDWELGFTEEEWQLLRSRIEAFQQWPQDRRAEVLYDKIVGEENNE